MNVMAQAHKYTKEAFQIAADNGCSKLAVTYKSLFRAMLVSLHSKAKEERQAKAQPTINLNQIANLEADVDAVGFALQGTALDSEGNLVHIGEYGSFAKQVEVNAKYYLAPANGFTKQELFVVVWGLEDVKESFKIIR